jgi:hypothetical protein
VIEVFITDITDLPTSVNIREALEFNFPEYQFNLDLDDCENVLRVNGNSINNLAIIDSISSFRNSISILDA